VINPKDSPISNELWLELFIELMGNMTMMELAALRESFYNTDKAVLVA
jgi:hypothetical protein